MKKHIMIALPLVALAAAGFRFLPTRTAAAQGNLENLGTCVSQVPETRGQFKGGSEQTGIAFEDSHGTIRFVTNFPCNSTVPPVALVVKRVQGN